MTIHWATAQPAATAAIIALRNNLIAENAAHDTTALATSGGGVHGRAVARGASALARLDYAFLTVADNQTELGTGGLQWEELLLQDSLGGTGAASFLVTDSIVVGNEGYGIGYSSPLDPATTVAVTYTNAFGNVSGNYQSPLLDPTGTLGNISVDAELDALFLPRLCGSMVDRGDPGHRTRASSRSPTGGESIWGTWGTRPRRRERFRTSTGTTRSMVSMCSASRFRSTRAAIRPVPTQPIFHGGRP
jgi:hypothetical protein